MHLKNQVTSLVLGAMEQKQLSRYELIRRMGYSSVNKGLRRLDLFLAGDELDPVFVAKVTEALVLDSQNINKAIEQDQNIKRARIDAQERAVFKPYIYLQTEATRPSQITIFALTGGTRTHKMFFVPEDLPENSWEMQINMVRRLTKAHYRLREGIAPFFGAITGYLYCPTYDSSYEFTLGGETDAVDRGHFCLPEASVRVS
jgi:hypothetical protein